jgi:hypothetical protein
MPYRTISIDERNLTIIGVAFSDIKSLRSATNALGSNMFKGFMPTKELTRIYRDSEQGKYLTKF